MKPRTKIFKSKPSTLTLELLDEVAEIIKNQSGKGDDYWDPDTGLRLTLNGVLTPHGKKWYRKHFLKGRKK